MQTEASLLQPVAPVREVSGDLPELQLGQAFAARIVESLPDNLYKALVTGRLLTLQLPEGAKPGDSLELVVVDRTARSVVAQRVNNAPAQLPPESRPVPEMLLSPAGRMIGQLLPAEGQAPRPVVLNSGQPLLAEPPRQGRELVPVLARAITESGLFYEAHQAQWVAGQRTLESLRAEPQARVSTAIDSTAASSATAPRVQSGTEAPATTSTGSTVAIPDVLRPVVEQQLDAIATQRLAWHGEVWPGQIMDLELEREPVGDRDSSGDDVAERWSTTLRLTLPRLGQLDARLQLVGDELRLRVLTDSSESAADLRAGSGELAAQLGSAGLNLRAMEVDRGAE
jgi:hypothetical protein